MADIEGSLFNYEGKSWTYLAEKLGFRSPSSDQDDEETVKITREASATRLKKDDMSIYGYCPRYEDFYLVVCNICNQSVKPQALKDHIVIRHNGVCSSLKPTKVDEKQIRIKKSSKLNPTIKILGKLDINETFGENIKSPIEEPRHDFSDNESLDYKSNLFNKDYDMKCLKDVPPVLCNNEPNNDSFMHIKEDLRPLVKVNCKGEYIDNVLTHTNAALYYLPPPVPPDNNLQQHGSNHSNITQHTVIGQTVGSIPVTSARRPSTPSMSPISMNAHSSTMGSAPSVGRPTTPGISQPLTPGRGPPTPGLGLNTTGIGPLTPGGMCPPTPGGMGPPTPGGIGPPTPGSLGPATPGSLGPTTPGGVGPATPGGLGPPTPGRGPSTPIMGSATPSMGPSPPVMVQQGTGVIHTLGSNVCGSQIIAPQSPHVLQHNSLVSLPTSSPYGPSMSPIATTIAYQNMPLSQSTGQSPLYSPVTATYQSGISTRQINIGNLRTISGQGLQTLNLHALPEVLSTTNSPVGVMCQERIANITINDQQMSGRGNHGRVMSTEEEEVNRISAMLMRETESMTVPQQVTAHDVVEAQGLAAGGIRRGPLLANNTYTNQMAFSAATTLPSSATSYQHAGNLPMNQQSSVPVPMNSINMATIKQLRDKLLEAVSESDLNAVLNVTPDAPVIGGNTQCLIDENNLNSFSNNTMSNQYLNISQIGNQGNVTFKNENDDLPNVDQITNELLEVDSYKVEPQYSNSQVSNIQSAGDLSESDELARAVGSITGITQENTNNYTILTSLLQQTTNSSPLQTVSLSHSNLESLSKTNSSEGITVVFESNPKNSQIGTMSTRYNQTITPSGISGTTLNHIPNELVVRSDLVSSSNLVSTGTQNNRNTRPFSQNQHHPTQISLKNLIQSNTLPNEQYENLSKLKLQSPQTKISNNQPTQYLDQHHSSGHYVQQQATNPIITIPPPIESPKSKKRRTQARKNVPLKDRAYDPEVHCGVLENGRPCTRSLTCKSHSLTNRRAVVGRSKKV